ncbi:hypothetical protein HGB07_08180, partial [Candidatus Roizmanbacteria bacterium]|nr:hypothetical protein [Candidatus Roizmanbacteria bacterium]
QGKNLFTPTGQIILKGNFGEKATYDIVPDAILKESNRVARATPSAEINCDTSASSRLCQSNVSLLVSGFFIGKYDLQAKVQFSENGTPIIGTTYFIALPIKLGGMVLVLLLIGGGMLWKRSKVVETKGDITSQ